MRKKTKNVPVFLIYAGVIHAIGLALLLPMLITLPGPGSEVARESAAIDVEIVPGSPLAGQAQGEQTSALPMAATIGDDAAAAEPEADAETAGPVDPDAEPQQEEENVLPREEPEKADSEAPERPKTAATKSSKPIAAKPAKKTVAARRSGKPSARAAKRDHKIAPFNGALSGLFSPAAPARRR